LEKHPIYVDDQNKHVATATGGSPLFQSGIDDKSASRCPRIYKSAKLVVPLLLIVLVILMALALLVGSADIAAGKIPGILWRGIAAQESGEVEGTILLAIRLPRVILAALIGACMAMAGVASQSLFRNPLASPHILGVSNGSALGATVAMLWLVGLLGYGAMPVMSMAGGLIVCAIVFVLARRASRFGHSLLLAGIAISAFCSALTAGALYLAGERLQTVIFWLMGGLWQSTWRDVLLMLPVTSVVLIALTALASAMNVALAGDRSAGDLGVHVRRLHIILLTLVAVGTAACVAVSGVIGFVGLIVPHLMRLIIGADHRGLIPASAAAGAILLLTADTMARTVSPSAEVPVGILTSLIGAPVFLWLLHRQSGKGGWT
jgi:iron complex transport system permease protein